MQTESTTKAITIAKIDVKSLTWAATLILIASVLPHIIHNQFITGPIVNATLFVAAAVLGNGLAVTVGLVPSVAALSAGLLPIVLAPMVPFIMVSNAVLVLTFTYLRKSNFWLAAITASIFKYLFLVSTSHIVAGMILQKNAAVAAAGTMMTWLQLATALAGAVIAYGILKSFNAQELKENNAE